MTAKKTVKKAATAPVGEHPPVRTPPKHGTFAPESGPSGVVTLDADAPGPLAAPTAPSDPKAEKVQATAQAVAENTAKAREVKVRATKRGQMANRIVEEGTVFVIQLDAGQPLPSWVVSEPSDDVPTSPVSHSAEAQEEVVDAGGIGHTPERLIKGT